MRMIKFRGKRLDNGEWVYGWSLGPNLIIPLDAKYTATSIGLVVHDKFEVLPESVGQWTGLVDKHGKEIYEGDILHRDAHQDMFVEFYKVAFCLVSCDPVQRANWSPIICRGSDIIYREIIGNIHDNPELMEV